ncbi:hypothetical protein [Sinorhizobium meliloti]|uniref:hypothetical protein n=1 Tax=Rhizobium meliloti TaxID=382 RepID=UPI0023807F5C|nr:hypothetical protein [Sinorhizobium meliloti]MDE3819719.1 hypothetical protein [Sinorhizobium meliloti]
MRSFLGTTFIGSLPAGWCIRQIGAKRSFCCKLLTLCAVFAVTGVVLLPTRASDHADPIALVYPEANITDLFFFPQGDRMILILDVRRALRNPGPYNLEPFIYQINLDFRTLLTFDSQEDRARYGGTIPQPEGIRPSATITLSLTNDEKLKGVKLKGVSYTGLNDTDKIDVDVGVRDDPFVFPRFFERNTIATVISMPMTSFPAGQQDFILWATASKDGELIDYVGRSLRTQLPRFGFLNAVAPSAHVKELMKVKKFWDGIYNFFRNKREAWPKAIADLIQFTFQIRPYDLAPDVLIYSNRFPASYPNGRLLTDDVVAQTCATGDCLLQELSFIEGKWPRASVNDKALPGQWPLLAGQWPDRQEAAQPTESIWPYVIAGLAVIAIVFWGFVEIIRRLLMRLLIRLWRALRPKSAAPA